MTEILFGLKKGITSLLKKDLGVVIPQGPRARDPYIFYGYVGSTWSVLKARAERDFVEDGRGLLPAAKKLRRQFANVIVDERRFPLPPIDVEVLQMFAGSVASLRNPGHRKPLTVEDARTG